MDLVINGESHNAPDACSMLDLLASLHIDPSRVAIEYNGLILRKDAWAGTALQPGDKVEIVHFVGGGCR
ncbi:MAG: sulfur carrier protein ThiS [Acidobacteria bacterium]|nr:sulfur carrier protein ThiS [Acidobacteriota bacterium]